MTIGERLEDTIVAVEQIEIELRGIRTQIERMADLFEEWLNGDPEPDVATRSFE